jgi:type IV pilus assembly protein PilM
LSSLTTHRTGLESAGPLQRFSNWLDARPHPDLVCQIGAERVALARWSQNRLEAFAEEPLPAGALRPSPSQANLADAEAVSQAVGRAVERVRDARREAVLLLPDTIVRLFLLGFESFPRKASDAAPLLRWRLRKSVPFPVEETLLSWNEQRSADGNLEVVTAVARESVIREYEGLLRKAGLEPGVVLGETLAALPLVEDGPAVLLVRLCGISLTMVIVDGGRLALHRCTELGAQPEAQALLDEIFPAVAFFQDRSQRNVERVRLSGMEQYGSELKRRLETELSCPVGLLGESGPESSRLPEGAADLLSRQLAPLVGWHLNRGA